MTLTRIVPFAALCGLIAGCATEHVLYPSGQWLDLTYDFSPETIYLKYLGTDKRGVEGVAALHFPGLHPEPARWPVSRRRINAIGIDTASIDYGNSLHTG